MKIQFGCGCTAEVSPMEQCDVHRMSEEMIEALHGLLDGLEANVDGRDGLTQQQWNGRIQYAREVFDKATGSTVLHPELRKAMKLQLEATKKFLAGGIGNPIYRLELENKVKRLEETLGV